MAVPNLDADGPQDGLRFGVLGPVQVLVDGRPVPVGSPGVGSLLVLLVRAANQVVSAARIIDGLWGDNPPATARTIVHGYVSRLRRLLRTADPDGAYAKIVTRPPGYELIVEESRIDLHRARRLLDTSHGQPAARRAQLLRAAAALWRGPAQIVPSNVAVELGELRLVVTQERIEAELELGRHASLVGELRALVAEHPFDEGLLGQLIRALYGSGQRADALAVYLQFQRRVSAELGIDPGPVLRELHELLLRDDPALRGGPTGTNPSIVVPAQLPPATIAFTGRDSEFGWLYRLLLGRDRVATTVAVITGAAGVGKSALAVTWGHQVSAEFPDGVLFAAMRGFDPSHSPRAPSEVLPRFLLALGVRTEDLPTELDEQATLYRSLLAARQVLVVLDDARDSEHVRPLLPAGSGSLVLVTSRRRLDGLVARSGARLLSLDTLPADAGVRLISQAATDAGVEITLAQAEALAQLCDNLPLALRVIAARLAVYPERAVDDLIVELSDEHTRLAALDLENADTSVSAALDVSYRGLHPAIGSAFRMLGFVPGLAVDAYVVAALCGTDVDSAARRLRALVEANLMSTSGPSRFVMHDLVRLHAKGLAETELSPTAADEALGRLLGYYRATCDAARRQLHPPSDDLDFSAMYRRIARPPLPTARHALDWFEAEWQNLNALLRVTVAAGRHLEAWHLVALCSHFLSTQASYAAWSEWATIGLASARTVGDTDGELQMLIVLSTARSRYGLAGEALEDAQLALRIATKIGDPRHIRTALGNVASGLYGQQRFREALLCDQEAHQLAVEAGDRMAQAHALNNMSQVEREMGQREEAVEHVRSAVELFKELGDFGYYLLALNNLAELCTELGRLDEAELLARQALALSPAHRPDLQRAFTVELLGMVLLARGDPSAADQLREALALSEQLGSPRAGAIRAVIASIARD
ncbi:MAG TPA: BTAD domain-containing putative transcriptional regulator [Pseudonocardiaceae bacterium]|jgi:DNA-binding SARP family transcriptional activator/tetratricopeptide (TPR) repeat protein|nr:BTAD domain-containing putative transcriptional regulator [Pseudonocardiaceae bacterium]